MAPLLKALCFLTLFHLCESYSSYRAVKCFEISREKDLMCANLTRGYNKIMLPNALGHDNLAEVRTQLVPWAPLVGSGCSPHLKVFLCSVFMPVCVQQISYPVPPCHSLCTSVRDSCEPVMKIHNYSWPAMFDCSKYLKDDMMCVPLPETPNPTSKTSSPPTPSTPSVCGGDDDKVNEDEARIKYCNGNFAIKARLQEHPKRAPKGNNLTVLKVKVLKVLKGDVTKSRKPLRLRLPFDANSCDIISKANGKIMKKPLLIIGSKKGKRLNISFLLKWPKKKATRRIKLTCR
ncbi:secreted frizzled-related protein 2 isoform X1 [Nematostella vectensis]|uniref:secreted frizzled-related protein 2 isoform X1 n=1 Tax=Nematostella vectensis TaxID=45351 RepID=UPI0013903700|nr:secreted frizzled-related protein 2 isoform X1 [Nematostella vectensis]